MTSKNSGTGNLTVVLEDEKGYTIYNENYDPIEASITLTSNAGFLQVIAYFFKTLFELIFGIFF